ncbi:hypothetical protein P8625_02770 [Tenacibaculum tangerinum]|uniref:DUF4178 domain-containing protein n=1 Tax=Tenacibaculum tangerinum TaxID=3038772 RepID=A0ABY8L3V0_9FLAO|nr:hypothetical protein [Tenacibaculum tangerinum]WGH76106.1 hypothetical protein P8625_02770 [Tenacibaculum tangerinum]
MKIVIRELYEFKDRIYEVASLEDVMITLKQIQFYSKFNFIVFKVNSEEDYEGIRLNKNGKQYYIEYFDQDISNLDKHEIYSISDYYGYLRNFLNEKEKKTKNLFEKLTSKKKEEEKVKYEKWKREYKNSKKTNIAKITKSIIVGLSLILLAWYVLNLLYTGNYKFIGQETEVVQAEIYKTNKAYVPGGGYYQRIYYKFKFEGKNYNDITRINRFVGKRKIGDKMKLKVSKSNPMRYVILEYLPSQ